MKILIFAPENSIHTKKWVEYFNSQNYEVLLVSFASHQEPMVENRYKNTEYLPLAFQHKLSYLFTFYRLRKIIRSFKPDLLHAHYVSSYGITGALAGFHPYVISVWGTDIYEAPRNSLIMRKLIQFAFRRSDLVCSTSKAMKEETEKYTDKPIVITPFGVGTSSFIPSPVKKREVFTFGIVKSLKPVYGINHLIKAYQLLKEMVPVDLFARTRLVIVGEGPLLKEYKALALELGISQQVEFKGSIPHAQVPAIMRDFDVFVMPSLQESFGVSALEAQSCGVPVIVTRVGGVPEIVIEGLTGWIVSPGDAKALSEKMLLYLQNEEMCSEFSAKAREFVIKEYNWEENASILEDHYKKVIANSSFNNSIHLPGFDLFFNILGVFKNKLKQKIKG